METKEIEGPHIQTKKDSSWGKFFIIIILILAISAAIYFYVENKKTQSLLKNPNQATEEETKSLIAKVSVLMELPTNEKPTIATVSDKTKLSGQPFFSHSQNGDKVLIYTQSKKAILFRPSINKIIEVAPINIADNPPTSIPSPTEVIPTLKDDVFSKSKITPTTPIEKVTPIASITP